MSRINLPVKYRGELWVIKEPKGLMLVVVELCLEFLQKKKKYLKRTACVRFGFNAIAQLIGDEEPAVLLPYPRICVQ